jgi:proteasome accessory factor B
MKGNRIRRIVRILTTLQSAGSYSAGELARIFKTSRRTIFRDLKELQAIGVPYRFSPKNKGYAIDPNFYLPPVDLNLQEALSLVVLVHKARDQIQLPFKNSALLGGLKIESNLPHRIKEYCNISLRNITAKASAQAATVALDRLFGELHKAIIKKRVVRMLYDSVFEGHLIELELSPYHLLYNRRAWYVLGFSGSHRSVRTFKLNRIKELEALEKRFTGGEDFDLAEYFGRAWSMIPEGRLYDVKLRFLPKVAKNVAEVQWHSTQKVERLRDGSVRMEFRVDGLGEISWWILGYGDQVQVLAPKLLRDRVVKVAQNMLRLNERAEMP